MTQSLTMPNPAQAFRIESLQWPDDWPSIKRLLEAEDWPFVQADLDVSHCQPHAVGLVAREPESQTLAGFFVAHHFGSVGYFDMMIVDEPYRRTKLATRLAYETHRALTAHHMRGFVAHSTVDSFDVFRFFGYERGIDFTLMRREPISGEVQPHADPRDALLTPSIEELIALDTEVFGQSRTDWIHALAAQPTTHFAGIRVNGRLAAAACLRQRREGAFCLDAINGFEFTHIQSLLESILAFHRNVRLECFARTDSDLHRWLAHQGWFMPDFFSKIGPLVEWRKGDTAGVGDSPHIRSLNWF